ncbi:hypothetical protein SAMN04515695_3112 [Pseudovibrio sp. Tun.PSC04-5.I4]|nr:hypothetical protein SAMN04515695_3112 [Pseudovibrio sp. Tun.PSC04-5.I4]
MRQLTLRCLEFDLADYFGALIGFEVLLTTREEFIYV